MKIKENPISTNQVEEVQHRIDRFHLWEENLLEVEEGEARSWEVKEFVENNLAGVELEELRREMRSSVLLLLLVVVVIHKLHMLRNTFCKFRKRDHQPTSRREKEMKDL